MKYSLYLAWVLLYLTLSAAATAKENTLKVFTWEGYIDPEIVIAFEDKYAIKVEFLYYSHDEHRDQVMAETNGFGFDVVIVDDVELPAYIYQKWLAPIDSTKIEYLSDQGDIWKQTVPSAEGYAVPYGWGTYGIAYRGDLLTQKITRWSDLFPPSQELIGNIVMPPQTIELLYIALLANGYPTNNPTQEQLKVAQQALLNQKQYVKSYQTIGEQIEALADGSVKAIVTYNTDALYVQEEIENLEFVSPEDGTLLWIDFLTISANSQNKEMAMHFINFLSQPEIAAQNSEYLYMPTFSDKANAMLPMEMKNNPLLFPNMATTLDTVKKPSKLVIRALMALYNRLNLE